MATFALGIDIGGTFTDVVAFVPSSGRQVSRKVLTSHDEPARAVIDGIAAVLEDDALQAEDCDRLVHATTLFTNALIERKGAKTGMLTTRGFRDTLEIGRERKYELYDLAITKPSPLVPRPLRHEVSERIGADGSVHLPLDREGLMASAQALVADGVEAVAVVFLHAYANAAHEREALALLGGAFPDLSLSISSDVAPEVREFERASTTVTNAYVKPLAERYLDQLAARAAELGISAPLHLMLSAGGLTHLDEAKRVPVEMLESGPAAGALVAAFFGRELVTVDDPGDLLALDMGGTTAKLAMVEDGEPRTTYAFEAARQRRFAEGSGLPIRISTVELIEIGAGGGSIAHLDALGLLKVGPESAGSDPGPASYGLGGSDPTVTDADFALGYLDAAGFAEGNVAIDLDAGSRALSALATAADLDTLILAAGIHDVVNESMASAARVHVAEQGRDPRDFTLLCTGGAGPVHAYGVARKLGIKRILCPPSAGVASALGLLVAPARVDKVATIGFRVADGDLAELEAAFVALEADAAGVLVGTGLPLADVTHHRLADGRFVGQGFDLVVDLPPGPYDTEDENAVRDALTGAFEKVYRQRFNRTPPDVPIEFINARLSARLFVPGGGDVMTPSRSADGDGRIGAREAYFPDAGGLTETAVHDRRRMAAGTIVNGPVIIADSGSTLIVGPGARAEVRVSGSIVVHLLGQEGNA
ncbi:MAG: hydantoinase/oxoprolinase family protein [Rhodospirillales bacterium]|jgi:N-methylhydantoinase A|nr:hydantoinase/oxoprolinase family protein [Rhodospirillales bacterium]